MRGKRRSKQARALDMVLEAVRYDHSGEQICMVRGYERRGFVWGDHVLIDRDALIERVKAKQRVYTGRQADLEGDFEVYAPVQLRTKDEQDLLFVEGADGEQEDLGLPLF